MDGPHSQHPESRKSILLVAFEPFGYHIDTFEYCRHLRGHYDITYLCLDNNLPRRARIVPLASDRQEQLTAAPK